MANLTSEPTKLIACVPIDETKYSLLEYDFTNKLLSRQTEVHNYGDIVNVCDEVVIFRKENKLTIYNIQNKSISSPIYCEKYFWTKFSHKIGDNVFMARRSLLYKLNIFNGNLEKISPWGRFSGDDYQLDAVCESNGEFKITGFDINYPRIIKLTTYDPLTNSWTFDLTDAFVDIKYNQRFAFGTLVKHCDCLYYFKNRMLHIYNLDKKLWRSMSVKSELYSISVEQAVSIDNQLIVCSWPGIYGFRKCPKHLKKLDIFGTENEITGMYYN